MRKRVYKRSFYCMTCDKEKGIGPINGDQFKEHLKSVHKLEGRITGSKSLTSALDFGGGHSNTFEWKLPGGLEVTEVSSSETVDV